MSAVEASGHRLRPWEIREMVQDEVARFARCLVEAAEGGVVAVRDVERAVELFMADQPRGGLP